MTSSRAVAVLRRPVAAACAAVLLAGCYTTGVIQRREHPQLAGIRLLGASEGEPTTGEELGEVTAEASGRGDCSDLVTRALLDLLAQARARGADEVRRVTFSGRFQWSGYPMCRVAFLGMKSVAVRGVARRGGR